MMFSLCDSHTCACGIFTQFRAPVDNCLAVGDVVPWSWSDSVGASEIKGEALGFGVIPVSRCKIYEAIIRL